MREIYLSSIASDTRMGMDHLDSSQLVRVVGVHLDSFIYYSNVPHLGRVSGQSVMAPGAMDGFDLGPEAHGLVRRNLFLMSDCSARDTFEKDRRASSRHCPGVHAMPPGSSALCPDAS